MRVLGPLIVLAGCLVAFAPQLNWFEVSVADGGARATGLASAGELAVAMALGILLLLLGLAVTVSPSNGGLRYLAGTAAVLAGCLAAALAIVAISSVPVSLVIADGDVDLLTSARPDVLLLGPLLSVLGSVLAVAAGASVLRRAATD